MSWKNVLLHIVLCLALCIVFLTGVLYWLTDDPQAFIGFLRNYRTVKADYYEPVSDRVLFEGAVNGMMKSLGDPYSTYLTGEKLSSLNRVRICSRLRTVTWHPSSPTMP